MATVLKCLQLLLLITSILGVSTFDLYFQRIEVHPADNPISKFKVNVEKTGKTSFQVSGNVELLNDMDDKYELQLTVYYSPSSTSSGYTQLIHLPRTGVCKILRTVYKNLIYNKLTEACVNAPNPDVCPLPSAKYEITDFKVDLANYEVFFIQGYYKVKVDAFVGNDLKAELIAYGYAIEK